MVCGDGEGPPGGGLTAPGANLLQCHRLQEDTTHFVGALGISREMEVPPLPLGIETGVMTGRGARAQLSRTCSLILRGLPATPVREKTPLGRR